MLPLAEEVTSIRTHTHMHAHTHARTRLTGTFTQRAFLENLSENGNIVYQTLSVIDARNASAREEQDLAAITAAVQRSGKRGVAC